MTFNDEYRLVYRENVYPDCIKFHSIHGLLATIGSLRLAQGVQSLLEEEGYTVKIWNPEVDV